MDPGVTNLGGNGGHMCSACVEGLIQHGCKVIKGGGNDLGTRELLLDGLKVGNQVAGLRRWPCVVAAPVDNHGM